MKIKSVTAQEILDSRGNPTVEAEVTLEDETKGWAAVPSGASTGKYEAVELRDGDKTRYHGEGVLKAVENVNGEINQTVMGLEAADQNLIDETLITLDGTENKARLGANAILSVSLAVAKAEAGAEKKQLFEYLTKFNPDFNQTYVMPIPEMNVMNGGKHANWATDIQEYMLFPIGAKSLTEAVRMNAEVYQTLKSLVVANLYNANVGDEGGFAPEVDSNEEPFLLLSEAIEKTGFKLGQDISLGIDTAASELWVDGKYQLKKEEKTVSSEELAQFYVQLMAKYPIVSMEDIFAEDDWEAFGRFTADYGDKVQIVGDDLYVTNVKRLQKGIEYKSTNAILIKLNQIGTLSETIRTILLARAHKMAAVVSHRSGETEDTFIADLVVAMGTGQIKAGAPTRSERVAKYNRLMNIERLLGDKAVYSTFP
jgi:enolase